MNFYQMNNLKIIFFGTTDFSLDTLKYLHNSNHKLISVVSSTVINLLLLSNQH